MIREALVHNLRDWVAACAYSLSVNWPHGLDACIETDRKINRFVRYCAIKLCKAFIGKQPLIRLIGVYK